MNDEQSTPPAGIDSSAAATILAEAGVWDIGPDGAVSYAVAGVPFLHDPYASAALWDILGHTTEEEALLYIMRPRTSHYYWA